MWDFYYISINDELLTTMEKCSNPLTESPWEVWTKIVFLVPIGKMEESI